MNKTVYIRAGDDERIWKRAQELNGGRLSNLLVELLRPWVARKEAEIEQRYKAFIDFQAKTTESIDQEIAWLRRRLEDLEKS